MSGNRLENDVAHELKDHVKRGSDVNGLARKIIRLVEEDVTALHLVRLSEVLRGSLAHVDHWHPEED